MEFRNVERPGRINMVVAESTGLSILYLVFRAVRKIKEKFDNFISLVCAIRYIADVNLVFNSVNHTFRDVKKERLLRTLHANGV
uniref:Uncharacterized protein n=1 Tax=Glossina austeni TaxID=7395 RepID=A0A1A9UME7_GLOAU